MNLFQRIALGTANWGAEYNGARVSDDDQKRILDYAQCSGIDTIDTATVYRVDWTKWNSCFKINLKIILKDHLAYNRTELSQACVTLMAHRANEYDLFSLPVPGVSIYEEADLRMRNSPSIIEVPYSLYDRRMERCFDSWKADGVTIMVRSIYLRGRILKDGISPRECLKFVLCNPYVDKVIIGVDGFEQFRENVQFIHTWNQMEKHDMDLLDPRRWKE